MTILTFREKLRVAVDNNTSNHLWSISAEVEEEVDIVEELIRNLTGDMPDDLLALAAHIIESEDFRTIPPITWRRRRSSSSSGRCYWNSHIAITAGSSVIDQTNTVIHELCHWKMGKDEHHSVWFYEQMFEWVHKFGADVGHAMHREFNYKKETAPIGYAMYRRNIFGDRWRP